MKAINAIAAALAASVALPAFAGFSIGGFGGVMDTELLGEGTYYGGQIEAGVEPISFIIRGGVADDFDEFFYDKIGYKGPNHYDLDEFCILPLEAGVLLRLPEGILPLIGIYGGGGVGYYYIPAIDIYSHHHRISETDPVDDLVGYWACAGVELDLSPVHVFAEAKYVDACDEVGVGWDDHHFTYEIDLTGWTCILGVRIGW